MITWELIFGVLGGAAGVATVAAVLPTACRYGVVGMFSDSHRARQDKLMAELATAEAQLHRAIRASVPQPGVGLPDADGSMTYCEWHDDLVPVADMVWANWGSEYVCRPCAERHDMEVPAPPPERPKGLRNPAPSRAFAFVSTDPEPFAAGVHRDGRRWALFQTQQGARTWVDQQQRHDDGVTVIMASEGKYWRCEVYPAGTTLKDVDPDSLAGRVMAKQQADAEDPWAMEQALRREDRPPHDPNCPGLHQVDVMGQVVACERDDKATELARVIGMDGHHTADCNCEQCTGVDDWGRSTGVTG